MLARLGEMSVALAFGSNDADANSSGFKHRSAAYRSRAPG